MNNVLPMAIPDLNAVHIPVVNSIWRLYLDLWEKAFRMSHHACPPLHTDVVSSERVRAYGGNMGTPIAA